MPESIPDYPDEIGELLRRKKKSIGRLIRPRVGLTFRGLSEGLMRLVRPGLLGKDGAGVGVSEATRQYERPALRLDTAFTIVNRLWQDAPDIEPDLLAEYEAIQAWPWITLGYQILEQSLKVTVATQKGIAVDEVRERLGLHGRKGHDLKRLFDHLEPVDREAVARVYASYRELHPYLGPATAGRFLDSVGLGYSAWRYMLQEGLDNVPSNHIGAMFELALATNCRLQHHVFGREGECPTVDLRVSRAIDMSLALLASRHAHDLQEQSPSIDLGAEFTRRYEQLRGTLRDTEVLREVVSRLEGTRSPRVGVPHSPNSPAETPTVEIPREMAILASDLRESPDRKNIAYFFRQQVAKEELLQALKRGL